MGREKNSEFEAKAQEAGFMPVVVPGEVMPHASVSIDGIGEQDDAVLIKLLEDTAAFIRAAGSRAAAQPYEQRELHFQRMSLGDTVALKHRS